MHFRRLSRVAAAFLCVSFSLGAQTAGTALVRRAPVVNGRVEGSVQVMTGENVTLDGNAVITGDLLVPGTPTVSLKGASNFAGTQDGAGAVAPTGYDISLKGSASLGHIVRRIDAIALPAVSAPPPPAGTRSVSINQGGQSPGDFATLRDLTLGGNAGEVAVPPGTYGTFAAASGNGYVLGVPGATEPVVYNFQNLALNSGSHMGVVGPVVVTTDGGFSVNAGSTMGAATHPEWLNLRIAGGGLTIGGGAAVHAHLAAPAGTVTLNGGSQFVGLLASDRLSVNGNALLRLAAAAPNQPPVVSLIAPADGAQFTAPAQVTLIAQASDSDGAIKEVEFFNGSTSLGVGLTEVGQPGTFALTVILQAGNYSLKARATDDDGAISNSAPVAVIINTPVNRPPSVELTVPADGASFVAPAVVHLEASATDVDGSVSGVEFFQGQIKLGESQLPPYSFDWVDVPAGGYTLTARATDDAGATATSPVCTVSVASGMPFGADFEQADGYTLGSLNGQLGWATDGASLVTDVDAQHGEQSMLIPGFAPPMRVTHTFPVVDGGTIVFVDFFGIPAAAADTASGSRYETDVARIAVVRSGNSGVLHVLAGDGNNGGYWLPTAASMEVDASGVADHWHRLTVRADYGTKKWDLYLDGALVAADVGFVDNARTVFSVFNLIGHPAATTLLDYFTAAFDNPLFADGDKDGMPDAWETAHGLDASSDDREGDNDGDGLANIREFLHGADPANPDTDGDGLPDGWEVSHGTRFLVNDGAEDPDADGLTNLQEFAAGTSPTGQDTDGDGLPDGWEAANDLDPLVNDAAADADGDGVSNLQEYLNGTKANDYYDGTLPEMVSLVPAGHLGDGGTLSLRVTDSEGHPLANAPVTFTAVEGGHKLAATPDAVAVSELVVRSDANGLATVYVKPGAN